MKIAFYAPFKPLGHPNPSGDLVIGTGIFRFLERKGHDVRLISRLRTRWMYHHPWRWPNALREYRRALRFARSWRPDIWLTYHTYYKAPDLLGPSIARKIGARYAVFQGIFSTKRRRDLRTLPGFLINTRALRSADHLFTNRREDWVNLKRLVPEDRLDYIPPGIYPEEFPFDPKARVALRREWGTVDRPVILSAAMFRPDVKTRGLIWVIESCGRLARRGLDFTLAIAGDGREQKRLQRLAKENLPEDRVRFVGKIPREEMHRFFSAGDLFVFPGIRESLGMVFLESQCCGVPVVAFDNAGVPEVVRHGDTGLLTPPFDAGAFDRAVADMVQDDVRRTKMGEAAGSHVRIRHDLNKNYNRFERILNGLVNRKTED